MSSADEQAGPPSGSVPHAYRNALFWRWVPAMPAGLPSAFVTTLYALAAAADPSGKVRFRDGRTIRIKDIAAATKTDEKDTRRYLQAAIAAGVLAVQGEQRRGKATLYVLVLNPSPVWGSAVWTLVESKRKSRKAPPWMEEKNGGVSPELSGAENGGHAPELETPSDEKERGTRPPLSSGDTPPFGSGDTPPNIPGIAKELPQEMDEVVVQPQVVGAPEPNKIDSPQGQDGHEPARASPGWTRCADCSAPMIQRADRPPRTHCNTCARDHTGATA